MEIFGVSFIMEDKTMKKAILAAIIAVAITTQVSAAIYPHMGEVTAVLPKANGYEITFTDGVGRRWSWIDDSGDWFTGDFVATIMDDNGTPRNCYDDRVVDARYVGYADLFI